MFQKYIFSFVAILGVGVSLWMTSPVWAKTGKTVVKPTASPTVVKKTPAAPVKKVDASTAEAKWVNFGYTVGKTSTRSIDTIVIHSSYNILSGNEFDIAQIIKEYQQTNAAPHYMVARDGTVYQLVKEKDIAWHAGVSKMPARSAGGKDGRTGVNAFSIGIEMIGTKTSGYTDAQYTSLKKLIDDIRSRYTIKNVVGHKDISPGRKTEPWQFDWNRV